MRFDHACARGCIQQVEGVAAVDLRRRRRQRKREVATDHRGGAHETRARITEAGERIPHPVGGRKRIDVAPALRIRHRACLFEVAAGLAQEERQAAGARVEATGQLRYRAPEHRRHQPLDLRLSEPTEHHVLDAFLAAQRRERANRRIVWKRGSVAHRRDHEDLRVGQLEGDMLEQPQRSRVGPVEVLEDHEQGALARPCAERAGDRVEEYEAALLLRESARRARDQPGQLGDQRGQLLGGREARDAQAVRVLAQQTAQDLRPDPERGLALLLQRATAQRQAAATLDLPLEDLREARLADAGGTAHHDEALVAAGRPVPGRAQAGERDFASDEGQGALYTAGFLANVGVPRSIDSGDAGPTGWALLANISLLGVFGLQHSAMARIPFKRWWTRFVPQPVERSTYVLASSLALILLFWAWQPMPTPFWAWQPMPTPFWAWQPMPTPLLQVQSETGRAVATGLFGLGLATVLYSTFLIDHFDLFELRQVVLYFRGRPYTDKKFVTPSLYKHIRHPLYVGWFLTVWATPDLSVGHALFAAIATLYILVAIIFEERDLSTLLGADYSAYRSRTPMFIPRIGRKETPLETGSEAAA
jgi:protein-S-isoprenylcysteine O-methyltransferase Ste14